MMTLSGARQNAGRIGKAVRFRHVPNAVKVTVRTCATGFAGKASGRDDPESEDRPESHNAAAEDGLPPPLSCEGDTMKAIRQASGLQKPQLDFDETHRDAVYRCIFSRRDVRGQFLPDPVPDDVLARILFAAHRAPSVGFMQPWDFIVVRDPSVKSAVRDAFRKANEDAARMFDDDRGALYRTLKLEGIVDAPLGICITCDRARTGPVVLGRTHQAEMDLYSSVCAVQNLWLAARAENVGVGWVSILDYDDLRAALGIPPEIQPVAYLCVGYVSRFAERPDLESAGWLPRRPAEDAVRFDGWQGNDPSDPLVERMRRLNAG